MAVISVTPPYPYFTDVDGDDLEAGFIYIGTNGQNPLINQIAVFSDVTLLIPIAQPIRTLGGLPVLNGSPTRLYTGTDDYSILVQDKNAELIYASLSNKTKMGSIDLSTDVTGVLASTRIQYDLSLAEISAGVVPVDKSFKWGSFQRYGMDPTGGSDCSAAFINAAKCNAEIYDEYPGGGTYRFDAEAITAAYPLTIRGQAKNVGNHGAFQTGTIFLLATVAGAGKACVRWNSFATGLRIQNISFQWQTPTTGQIGLRFSSDMRGAKIEHCAFIGGAGSGTNLVGIQSDNPTIFSGLSSITDCYFSSIKTGVWLQGSNTTWRITNSTFIGYSGNGAVHALGAITPGAGYVNGTYQMVPLTGGAGTGALGQVTVAGGAVTSVVIIDGGTGYAVANVLSASAASLGGAGAGFSIPVSTVGVQQGYAVRIDYPAGEGTIAFNHMEGYTTAILCNGGAYLNQFGNTYETNIVNVNWYKTLSARVWNQSIGEGFLSGGNPVYTFNDNDANVLLSGPGTGTFDIMSLQADRGFASNRRTTSDGYWLQTTFAAGDYTANGGATWTVTAPQVDTSESTQVGLTMHYVLRITGSATSAASPTQLIVKLPQGVFAVKKTATTCIVTIGATKEVCQAEIAAGSNLIAITRLPGTGFGTVNIDVYLSMTIDV